MPDNTHSLSKEERLHGKTAITALTGKGKWAMLGHFSYCVKNENECRDSNGDPFCRIIASVPKKHFKRAVKRNLLKRRIREAYRLQKGILKGKDLDILFSYNSQEILSSQEVFDEIGTILRKLA